MKHSYFQLIGVLLLCTGLNHLSAQHTFSIVAIDTVTGEIGSAGATCLDGSFGGGAVIISRILPGIGATHTQAQWNAGNQQNADTRMAAGDNASQIVNWLVANDVQGDPTIRQYGVVTMDANGSINAEGYTGINCFDYKNHITGPNYSIQGNILLGQQILDSMEARFLNASGSLADKLMACMQGANVPGADTRCLASGVSSFTSFLRVSRPSDFGGVFYLDLQINSTPPNGVDPIDALQSLYDAWTPPNCDITIPTSPSPTLVQDTTLITSSAFQTYLVCPGDTLQLSSSIENTVYLLGAGSYCSIGGFSATNTVYVVDSAVFDGSGSIGTSIYADPGSRVIAPGDGAVITLCDSVTYLNLNDFPGICEASTSNHQELFRDIIITNQFSPASILIEWPVDRRLSRIELYALDGRQEMQFDISGSDELRIPTTELSAGIYLLKMVERDGRVAVRKVKAL